jgi:hypothetical protein
MSAVLRHGRGRAGYAACCVSVCLLAVAAQVHAGVQPGTYRCWSFHISGGAGSCRLSPPITIRADGTYDDSATQGTWRARGDRITFSHSKTRGAGVVAGNRIVFEYDFRGMHHTVTYVCQECGGDDTRPPAGAR